MAKIEIDGKILEVPDGSTIIQAADDANIPIPRFCYHKKLSVAANCRMCLVEVEKMGKPMPACATPVSEGMKIYTKSEKALEAQKAVMEFLLINHPLDCPVCDQGGQCELQDLAMGFGADVSRYAEGKRAVEGPDLGPLVATDMTRCIHCTRCVRFGEEIAGVRELGGVNRGEHMEITTHVKHTMRSELSGNVIDICPVGALTSKPFRFEARAWELQQFPGIAPHDCLGSHLHLNRWRNDLLRVNPRENEAINEVWISDRDRFSYKGVHSEVRALGPMIKKEGKWKTVDWETAFQFVADQLGNILNQQADAVGILASPSATTEELFLLQKIARGLGVYNIDHRLRQLDFTEQHTMPLLPTLGINIQDIESRDAILLVGSNIQKEQPMAGLRVRKAQLKGAKIAAINMVDFDFHFSLTEKTIIRPDHMVEAVAQVLKAAIAQKNIEHEANALCDAVEVTESAKNIAALLCESEKASIILGAMAAHHPQAGLLQHVCQLLSEVTGATIGCLTEGANAQGAWLAGAIPHRGPFGETLTQSGFDAQEMLQRHLKAYVLFGVEPELDAANSGLALQALTNAEQVICLTPFVTESMKQYATVILPMTTLGETSGTFVNIEGCWQSFQGMVPPKGEARPGWKVLRVLGNTFELSGFDYMSSQEVLQELQALSERSSAFEIERRLPKALTFGDVKGLQRIGEISMYSIDNLVRQSEPLQKMVKAENTAVARLNKNTLEKLKLQNQQSITAAQGEKKIRLSVMVDERIPDDSVFIPAGIQETVGLGELYGKVTLESDA